MMCSTLVMIQQLKMSLNGALYTCLSGMNLQEIVINRKSTQIKWSISNFGLLKVFILFMSDMKSAWSVLCFAHGFLFKST